MKYLVLSGLTIVATLLTLHVILFTSSSSTCISQHIHQASALFVLHSLYLLFTIAIVIWVKVYNLSTNSLLGVFIIYGSFIYVVSISWFVGTTSDVYFTSAGIVFKAYTARRSGNLDASFRGALWYDAYFMIFITTIYIYFRNYDIAYNNDGDDAPLFFWSNFVQECKRGDMAFLFAYGWIISLLPCVSTTFLIVSSAVSANNERDEMQRTCAVLVHACRMLKKMNFSECAAILAEAKARGQYLATTVTSLEVLLWLIRAVRPCVPESVLQRHLMDSSDEDSDSVVDSQGGESDEEDESQSEARPASPPTMNHSTRSGHNHHNTSSTNASSTNPNSTNATTNSTPTTPKLKFIAQKVVRTNRVTKNVLSIMDDNQNDLSASGKKARPMRMSLTTIYTGQSFKLNSPRSLRRDGAASSPLEEHPCVVIMTVEMESIPSAQSDTTSAEHTALLNSFVCHVMTVVKATRGSVHSYRNGQLTLTWTRSRNMSRPHVQALRAAFQMVHRSKAEQQTLFIGIDQSPCIVGDIGDPTVMMFRELSGTALESSLSLCLLARMLGGSIFVSDTVYRDSTFACLGRCVGKYRRVGHVPVYCFHQEEEDGQNLIYDIVDLRASEKEMLDENENNEWMYLLEMEQTVINEIHTFEEAVTSAFSPTATSTSGPSLEQLEIYMESHSSDTVCQWIHHTAKSQIKNI